MPHHYQGTVGNARERRKNDREKKKKIKNEGVEEKKMILFLSFVRSFFFLFFFLFLFIDSTHFNYNLQFWSDGRITRDTFWWKIIVTVTFIQKWFASMHSTTTSCCCFTSCSCTCCTMLLLIMWWCRWYMMRIDNSTWWWWTIHIKTKIYKEKKNVYLIVFFKKFHEKKMTYWFLTHITQLLFGHFFQMLIWCLMFFSLETRIEVYRYIYMYGYMYVCVQVSLQLDQ